MIDKKAMRRNEEEICSYILCRLAGDFLVVVFSLIPLNFQIGFFFSFIVISFLVILPLPAFCFRRGEEKRRFGG